jgi:hypothetical protein
LVRLIVMQQHSSRLLADVPARDQGKVLASGKAASQVPLGQKSLVTISEVRRASSAP